MAISRATRYDALPPPLESPTICDGNFSHISQVDRVCFTSVRRDGRLILVEKPQPLIPPRFIRSQRSNGRLQLRLYVDNTEQNQYKKENPIAEFSSLKHEQHYPLRRKKFDVQKQHNSLAAVSLSKHGPFSENGLRPRHPQQKPLAKSISQGDSLIATYTLPVQRKPTTTNTLRVHHFPHIPIAKAFSPEQDRPAGRVANNSMRGGYCTQRPSAKGILQGPIQHNPCAEFGKEEKSKAAENVRRHIHVCVQEQCECDLVARIAFSAVEHCQQSPMAESLSSQRLQHILNAEIEREESPDAQIARERNPNAEIAKPRAEINSREESSTEKERTRRAGSRKKREGKRKQENASAIRLIRGPERERERESHKQRVLMKCDAYNNSGYTTQAFKSYDLRSSTRNLAFLHNSLRPLCMLNL